MSSLGRRTVSLGEVEPAGSRHLGKRSTVALADDTVLVGTASGDLRAFDRSLSPQWTASGPDTDDGSLVSIDTFEGTAVVGERGPSGAVHCHDLESGELLWRYETADDVGEPQNETRFLLPFVADVVAGEKRVYVAARRYERGDDGRTFHSVVYAFDPGGSIDWRYRADASPISLAVRDRRVAVAYNRCPGDHQCGLVVLDRESGAERTAWDPGTDGGRRVGDVSLLADGVAVASHGDYCGYRLNDDGSHRWRVPLATPEPVDGERVYAYPNHVHATSAGAVFVTGNTYPEDGRETEARHPNEHRAVGVTLDGERGWQEPVGGFATSIGTAGDRVAVPSAQHFRDRDAAGHGLQVFDAADGTVSALDADGVVTAAALDDEIVVAVEEPVAYHDEDERRGAYRALTAERE
ncbi:outer membrane protein assembly factor BamB family protein [Halorientalis regularis]|uniref:PQQ-like domain-containing protein n=1 Tax=Halorientalis regularis TaxID=660518 RepID=A0A1G7R6P4_9EURY|nr:PQQ-binding-like beta-propeller repeat protein [Halorientalis regularis]SDG05819.1 PQQ-like domain-containing protein [Halorientalis regularis]